MTRFKYIVENGLATIDGDCSLFELACEVGHLANSIYSAYMNHDPKQAIAFQSMVMEFLGDPDSPIWKQRESQEGDIEIIEHTIGDGEEIVQ